MASLLAVATVLMVCNIYITIREGAYTQDETTYAGT